MAVLIVTWRMLVRQCMQGSCVGGHKLSTAWSASVYGVLTALRCWRLYAGLGAILSAAAVAFPMLVAGKIVYGLGIGFALHAAPAYLAEVGHPRIRGLLIRRALGFLLPGLHCHVQHLLQATYPAAKRTGLFMHSALSYMAQPSHTRVISLAHEIDCCEDCKSCRIHGNARNT